jgi:tRNA modification GTPase
MPLHIIDTAGLRDSDDPVEQEGVRRAWNEIRNAERILLLVDSRAGVTAADWLLKHRFPEHIGMTLIRNKIDLTGETAALVEQGEWGTEVLLSAKTGQGMQRLREHLKNIMGYRSAGEGRFIARRRHLDALQRVDERLQVARYQLEVIKAGELMAEELRLAQQALSEITGEFTSDDLLGKIFSTFCIGK